MHAHVYRNVIYEFFNKDIKEYFATNVESIEKQISDIENDVNSKIQASQNEAVEAACCCFKDSTFAELVRFSYISCMIEINEEDMKKTLPFSYLCFLFK
jgi:hypothetical protein